MLQIFNASLLVSTQVSFALILESHTTKEGTRKHCQANLAPTSIGVFAKSDFELFSDTCKFVSDQESMLLLRVDSTCLPRKASFSHKLKKPIIFEDII